MFNFSGLIEHVKKRKYIYLFILPSLIFSISFTYFPTLFGIWVSFQDFYMRPLTNPDFVFLDNYAKLLRNQTFLDILRNSFLWTAVSVSTTFLIGFGFALLLNEKIGRLRGIFRILILFSWAVPWVVAGILWKWIYNPQWGIISKTLVDLGITESRLYFLSDTSLVWPSLLVYFWWTRFPFTTISMLAALQTVPDDLYEAARVDGANAIQRFRHVTAPYVKPTIVTVLLLTTIWGFNDFGAIWSLTKGGPGSATDILPTYAYRIAFITPSGAYLGQAAAVSVILFLITFAFAVLYVRRFVK